MDKLHLKIMNETQWRAAALFHHITVLKQEATEGLRIKPDGIYVDCTLGEQGTARLLLPN